MNREVLAATAPRWTEIEAFPAQTKFDMLALWTEAIMDTIDRDHLEPDTWEAMSTYALHALVEGGTSQPSNSQGDSSKLRRPPQVRPGGPPPVTLADLRHAMEQIRARPATG